METQNFRQCIGVFEGGGVRGAAFAGAFKAASDAKINFIGTLGTSAGSIIAVLIAAGFLPDEVIDIMKKPFAELLKDPEQGKNGKFAQKAINLFGNKKASAMSQIYYSMGLHSSEGIQIWLEKILKDKLKITNGNVLFSDLKKPCAIIATDLKASTFGKWSRDSTPDASVSLAVRCSCTIPFFFQPVKDNATFYVDGGLIANLPIFMAPELKLEEKIPILCFRLIQNKKFDFSEPETGLELFNMLTTALLDGVTEIQLSMFKRRQVIDIPTGEIKSTDFNISEIQIKELVENGTNSVEEFVRNEQTKITSEQNEELNTKEFREGLLEETAKLINSATNTVEIVAGDLSWIKELNITILKAVLRKIKIKIICEKNVSEDYKNAISALDSYGAQIVERNKGDNYLKGTAIDLNTENAQIISIEEKPTIRGIKYRLPYDSGFIAMFRENFNSNFNSGQKYNSANLKFNPKKLKFKPIPDITIINCLRKIHFYQNLPISIQTLETKRLRPLSKFLEQLKINRAMEVEDILKDKGFSMSAVIGGSPWIITPPVVERLKNDEYAIIDGTHRIYNSMQKNQTEAEVYVVENSSIALPASIQEWSKIIVRSVKAPVSERYDNYNESLFRKIKDCFVGVKV